MLNIFRVATVIPEIKIADIDYNLEKIIKYIDISKKKGANLLVFPRMILTGSTLGDLILDQQIIKSSKKALDKILSETIDKKILVLVSLPMEMKGVVAECALLIFKGKIIDIFLDADSNNHENFRYMEMLSLFKQALSHEEGYNASNYDVLGEIILSENNLTISVGFNIENTNFLSDLNIVLDNKYAKVSNKNYSHSSLQHFSQNKKNIVYLNPSSSESTTDGVMAGSILIAENGKIVLDNSVLTLEDKFEIFDIFINPNIENINSSKNIRGSANIGFSLYDNKKEVEFLDLTLNKNILRKIEKNPFIEIDEEERNRQFSDIFSIQSIGLAKRLKHIGAEKSIVAVSGGLDSTLALLVTIKAHKILGLDVKNIIGITMPGFGTSKRTYNNALEIMKRTGITQREIPIKEACLQHFLDIGHDKNIKNLTYENAQARERTQIAMDIAGMENGILVGTGDLSELVLGFATYNGDHMSMYSVNSGLPKTVVKALTLWLSKSEEFSAIKDLLGNIVNTPVSPELLPPDEKGEITQVTEKILGPYSLNDFFIYYCLGEKMLPTDIVALAEHAFDNEFNRLQILQYLKNFYKRFITQQFKRSCMPDGVAVYNISVSPREGLSMPSDASFNLWVDEIENEIKSLS